MESNPEYFIPGEKSSHKLPKATQHGEVEAEVEAGGEEDSVNCHKLHTLPEEFLKLNKLWNKAVQILRWL